MNVFTLLRNACGIIDVVHRFIISIAPLAALLLGTGAALDAKTVITQRPFGHLQDGREVELFTMKSGKIEAAVMTYGGRIVTLKVPDRNGKVADIVLGFDSLQGYLGDNPYFGALIGRYGNRIGGGMFTLDGQRYTLAKNDGANSLHGGVKGFDKVLWSGRIEGESVVLTYRSKDGEEGYPGNLNATVRYTVADNELKLSYEATTDMPTVINLTNHSYFNLAGQGEGDILGQEMMLAADRFLPVDKGLIPTGEMRNVAGTPFDFRAPHRIGERIDAADEQIRYGRGYDHNWILNGGGAALKLAARARDPQSGRAMEVSTTEPGVQFYTGNFLDGTIAGKGGKRYGHRSAFCLETQHFPDSPNHPVFPSTVLRPGQKYFSTTVYRFIVE
jgi:aldose 1-epimerase